MPLSVSVSLPSFKRAAAFSMPSSLGESILYILVSIFLIVWFAAAFIDLPIVFSAASDTAKNEFGGPLALSSYIESFYYKVIFTPLFQLPILYSIFAFLGGLLAISFNKKED